MDKVEKTFIPRWGNFYFSWKYDSNIIDTLLEDVRQIYSRITYIPVLPEVFSRIEEDVIRRSIFGTAALEGNPLSEWEVGKILHDFDKINQAKRAEQEIINLKDMYEVVQELEPGDFPITEKKIKLVHKTIMRSIDEAKPGEYRTNICRVGDKDHGGTYKPPVSRDDIQLLMQDFTQWINQPELGRLDPYIQAALSHFHLGRIHPFEDGNGRTSRVIEAIMMKWGSIRFIPIMQSNYYYRHMDDYYWAFSLAGKNKSRDVTPFLEFVCKGIIESLNNIMDMIYDFINRTVLKEYYATLFHNKTISRRQYDFLSILLDDNIDQFSLRDLFTRTKLIILYRAVSERTARRDISRLIELKLLTRTDEDSYHLNFNVLKLMQSP